MTIVIRAKGVDDIIGLKEDISARLEDIVEIERIDVEEKDTKELTTVTTIEITAIHKGKDDTFIKPKAEVENEVKEFIEDHFVCDTVNVKHQRFVRD